MSVVTVVVAPMDVTLGGVWVVCAGANSWVGGVKCRNDVCEGEERYLG